MSSSSWECAPGPFVCGSSHHSEIEYLSSVSAPSARKRLEMRPIGYDRPPPGGRNTPCLAMRRGCAARRRSSWRKVRALLGKLCTGGRAEADGWLSHDEDFGEPGVGRPVAACKFRGTGPTLHPGLTGRTSLAAAAAGGGPGRGSPARRG